MGFWNAVWKVANKGIQNMAERTGKVQEKARRMNDKELMKTAFCRSAGFEKMVYLKELKDRGYNVETLKEIEFHMKRA